MTRPDEDLSPSGTQLDPAYRDPEAPPADAAEQAAPVAPTEEPDEVHPGLEVNEWDAVEQAIVIDLEDEYR